MAFAPINENEDISILPWSVILRKIKLRLLPAACPGGPPNGRKIRAAIRSLIRLPGRKACFALTILTAPNLLTPDCPDGGS
jgi:hypothetical protein